MLNNLKFSVDGTKFNVATFDTVNLFLNPLYYGV